MLWPLTVVLVANTNGRLAIPALAGLLVGRLITRAVSEYMTDSVDGDKSATKSKVDNFIDFRLCRHCVPALEKHL